MEVNKIPRLTVICTFVNPLTNVIVKRITHRTISVDHRQFWCPVSEYHLKQMSYRTCTGQSMFKCPPFIIGWGVGGSRSDRLRLLSLAPRLQIYNNEIC